MSKCKACRGGGRDLGEPNYRCPDCEGTGEEVERCNDCDEPVEDCSCDELDLNPLNHSTIKEMRSRAAVLLELSGDASILGINRAFLMSVLDGERAINLEDLELLEEIWGAKERELRLRGICLSFP